MNDRISAHEIMLVHIGLWDKGWVVWWLLTASAFVRASRKRQSPNRT